MSRMQVVQQKQPQNQWEKAKAPLKITAVIVVQTVAIVASIIFGSGIFAITAAMALSMGMAISLKERSVILATATAFTTLIAAVSISVLFPPSAPFMLSLVCGAATFSLGWGLKQECANLPKKS